MPKQKTRKTTAKRVKVTGSGRLLRRRSPKHDTWAGSAKRNRKSRKKTNVANADKRSIKKQLGL